MQTVRDVSPQLKNVKRLALSDFWMRLPGNSQRLFKLARYDQLSVEEQIFARLMVGDNASVSALIEGREEKVLGRLCRHAEGNQLARLIYDRMQMSGFSGQFPEPVKNQLRTAAFKETATHKKVEKQFCKLLNILSEADLEALFIKGPGLSYTVYELPEYRCYGDFDVVVRANEFAKLASLLTKHDFKNSPTAGFCSQLGVGPTEDFSDLVLAPTPDLIQTSLLGLSKDNWPTIDLKISPIDRGLQLHEIDRIFSDASVVELTDARFKTPCRVDHLMIMLSNLAKDRFLSWKNLLDVHLLASLMSTTEWTVLVARSRTEALSSVCWGGLWLSVDRFGTVVPDLVLSDLAPRQPLLSKTFQFSTSPYFVWNATSLPTFFLTALVADDKQRLFKTFFKALNPSDEFLSTYYRAVQRPSLISKVWLRLLHFFTLLMPGGIVRRTCGSIWRSSKSRS